MALLLPTVGQRDYAVLLLDALRTLDSIGPTNAFVSTTVSNAGTIVLDASKGAMQQIVLEADVTGSSIINGVAGQTMVIQWLQDATGGRAYAWPNNCLFADATPPTSATLAKQSILVTFVYDGTNWLETGRSAAVEAITDIDGGSL